MEVPTIYKALYVTVPPFLVPEMTIDYIPGLSIFHYESPCFLGASAIFMGHCDLLRFSHGDKWPEGIQVVVKIRVSVETPEVFWSENASLFVAANPPFQYFLMDWSIYNLVD